MHDKTLFNKIENKLNEINETLIYIEKALDFEQAFLLDKILLPSANIMINDANQLISDIKCTLNGVETKLNMASGIAIQNMVISSGATIFHFGYITFGSL